MEKEKNSNKDSFSAGIYGRQYAKFVEMAAHDLQAPLRKLGVFTDQLTNKYQLLKDEQVEHYTRRIHACIAEMRSLIEGFTELAGAIPETMHYEVCDPEEIIKRILQESTSQIKQKEAVVSIRAMPVIQGDKVQLRLLFEKLLKNSFLFSKPGIPLRIEIDSERLTDAEKEHFFLPENRSFYKIRLADNGIGIEPGDAERIFQPLVRLHGKSAFPGNGLGLALVKKIADNHKGIVYAEDNSEEGVRVILIIPEKP